MPEFALYMPGMAGNLQFVIKNGSTYKKLIEADHIETRYQYGKMFYRITDKLLDGAVLKIEVLAQYEAEGMVVKITSTASSKAQLLAIYGGASGKTFSRNGDIGADPESGVIFRSSISV